MLREAWPEVRLQGFRALQDREHGWPHRKNGAANLGYTIVKSLESKMDKFSTT